MQTSKNPILEIEPYPNDFEYEEFCIALGTLVKQRFPKGYVKCKAENLGWQKRSGQKVFTVDTTDHEERVGRHFLTAFTPPCDWSAKVYSLHSGKGLYIVLSHHDSQGEFYYFTPICKRTYDSLR